MDRTVMVVNTSNMPVAAREASIYLGITIAEYYRDMGFRVALMADSLSRWAEALREISARLEEMPGEEGYPDVPRESPGQFYERAGYVRALGVPDRSGALTLISAISPPGGDLSEPVTQASLRITGALWALDPALAHQRQFPAVDWETSYSHYVETTAPWFAEHGGADWAELRQALLTLLQRGQELREIAALVGPEALQDSDRVLLDLARLAREAVLGQSAYDPNDASSPIPKTYQLIRLMVALHRKAGTLLKAAPLSSPSILNPPVRHSSRCGQCAQRARTADRRGGNRSRHTGSRSGGPHDRDLSHLPRCCWSGGSVAVSRAHPRGGAGRMGHDPAS
jgi:V/A-type H+-transporting ATPase subunit A